MTIIYLLIPLSLILTAAAIGAFFWAVRSGQFDDMHTPALKILDDEEHSPTTTSNNDREN
ncbi:MAG: cbb3-type cytochrome oxidase assembly protein CcoS [Thiolinea sp.]